MSYLSLLLCCDQIRKLESTLMDMDNKTLWNDYRIAQPLNDRVVESSFLPRLGKGSMYCSLLQQCDYTTGKYHLFLRIDVSLTFVIFCLPSILSTR